MDKKDLFKGLNYIDDNLISEAAEPYNSENVQTGKKVYKNKRKNKVLKVAAGLTAAAAMIMAVFAANDIFKEDDLNVADDKSYKQKTLGNSYATMSSYKEIYKKIQSIENNKTSYDYRLGADGDNVLEDSMADSSTNIMTEGVDESDIAKTDGKYIYMVESGDIIITDISKGEPGSKKIFTPDFELPSDEIKEMYVSDGKMILIVNHIKEHNKERNNEENDDIYYIQTDFEETVCYSYDLSNPEKPKIIGKMRQDGIYKTSRRVGNIVYLFSSYSINRPDMGVDEAVESGNLDKWIPTVNGCALDCDRIFMSENGINGTMITTFDVSMPEKSIDAEYVMNGYGNVYVSADAIYFYSTNYMNRCVTEINKMSFSKGKLKGEKSTSIRGIIPDVFAINEQNENLIVISTDYNYSDGDMVNTLYVFNSEMKQIGVLNGIALGERVYAARFIGNLVYFITYKQIDPLFVADISNPAAPKMLGELEVEGFSEYLHKWDDNHILGIGYMTKDVEKTGIKITMFDVTDPENPIEENCMIIDGKYNGAVFDDEYKSVLVNPDKNIIGFATDEYITGEDTDDSHAVYHHLKYDKENGFTIVRDTRLPKDNSRLYRGLYCGDDFYIAGAGDIIHYSLSEIMK